MVASGIDVDLDAQCGAELDVRAHVHLPPQMNAGRQREQPVAPLRRYVVGVRPWLFVFAVLGFVIVGGWVVPMAAGLTVLSFSQAGLLEHLRTCASAVAPVPFLLPTWRLWKLAIAFHRCANRFEAATLSIALAAHCAFWRAVAIASGTAIALYSLSWSLLRLGT